MRFAVSAALVAALPGLAVAENPLDQYVAQFQNFLGNMGSYIPNPGAHDPVAAAEAKVGSMKLHTLTLENWRDTLYEPVSPGQTTPTEWWVLITGRNKTCFGRCGVVEQAFNETAGKFAVLPGAPHMGILNCDDQPVLCNAWSAGSANIWNFEMLPPPAAIDIYRKRLNMTTTTSADLVALRTANKEAAGFRLLDSWFHPFNGKAAELGLAVPFGYFLWAFNMVPNWLFMLVVSFASRSMMSNRMNNMQGQQQARAGGAAPAAAR